MKYKEAANVSVHDCAFTTISQNQMFLYCGLKNKGYRVDQSQDEIQVCPLASMPDTNDWQIGTGYDRALIDGYEESLIDRNEKIQVGNMEIQQITAGGVVTVKCHCGCRFISKPILPVQSEEDGTIKGKDGESIDCGKCGCKWRKEVEPEMPKSWMYFVVHATFEGDDTERPAVTGNALNHAHFAATTLFQFLDQYDVKSYSVEQVDFQRYTKLKKESSTQKVSAFLSYLLGG